MFELSDTNTIITGVLILLVAWSLRRSFREQSRISSRDPLEEAQKEIATREQSQLNRLDQLEVKLYEYGREVEARSDDRLLMLDELLREADREINRLRQQLALAQQNMGTPSASSEEPGPDIVVYENPRKFTKAAERRFMIVYLSQAGFSSQEISNCFQCSQSEIETILAEENEPPATEIA
ncbi:MAG: hypothetical protein KDA77_09430 [Planctomycetaceae bacterium]|nr:hypothetical protein [Planctomycetaceae bacterium]